MSRLIKHNSMEKITEAQRAAFKEDLLKREEKYRELADFDMVDEFSVSPIVRFFNLTEGERESEILEWSQPKEKVEIPF